MNRTVNIGTQNYTKVICTDEPGPGNACHKYKVILKNDKDDPASPLALVSFQNGPVKESGINGCHNEDLLAIVIDRLNSFQHGEFKCRENALAITKLEEAMHWLNHRTQDRKNRGVEGTSQE